MDNENFKQQFTQNIRSASVQPVAAVGAPSRLPFIIALALAAIVLVESIALLVTLTNYFSAVNNYFAVEPDDVINEEAYVDNTYVFDKDGNLSAMELICTSTAGNKYVFNKDNTFVQSDSSSNQTGSGSYSITNDSLISLNNSDHVLYYDGFSVADGTTLYSCEEVATNGNSAE